MPSLALPSPAPPLPTPIWNPVYRSPRRCCSRLRFCPTQQAPPPPPSPGQTTANDAGCFRQSVSPSSSPPSPTAVSADLHPRRHRQHLLRPLQHRQRRPWPHRAPPPTLVAPAIVQTRAAAPADGRQRRQSTPPTPPTPLLPPASPPTPFRAPPTTANDVGRPRQRPDARFRPRRPPSTTLVVLPTSRRAPPTLPTAANADRDRCRHRQHRPRPATRCPRC